MERKKTNRNAGSRQTKKFKRSGTVDQMHGKTSQELLWMSACRAPISVCFASTIACKATIIKISLSTRPLSIKRRLLGHQCSEAMQGRLRADLQGMFSNCATKASFQRILTAAAKYTLFNPLVESTSCTPSTPHQSRILNNKSSHSLCAEQYVYRYGTPSQDAQRPMLHPASKPQADSRFHEQFLGQAV